MKRNISCILLIASVLLSSMLYGCNAVHSGKYKAYVVGYSDSGTGITQSIEYTVNMKANKDVENAAAEASVTFLNTTTTGTYQESEYSDLYPNDLHIYECAEDKTEFRLDAQTGALRYWC